MYSDHAAVSAIRYSHPELSGEAEEWNPEGLWTPQINPHNILYRTLFEPFNAENYLYPRLPVDMGLWNLPLEGCPNVLRMPLKMMATGYMLPVELAPLKSLIKKVAEYEKNINPWHDETFCHVTVDRSLVEAGQFHRFPGYHGDGYQGAKFSATQRTAHDGKIKIEHSYILVTDPPTEVCLQPFFVQHLDETKHSQFLEFDRQAKECNIYRLRSGHMYLIDPYIVHRTPPIQHRVDRTFIRITYTFTELDHPKNTINPAFGERAYEPRIDIRENLVDADMPIPYEMYGLQR